MRIIFMGTPEFAVPCLEALIKNGYDVAAIVTQPDKPFGRNHSKLKPPPVKEAALAHGISAILQPEKVKTPEFRDSIRELKPDLIVTAAYGRILTKEVLDIPQFGCINVHASLLPKYRGAAPIQWAIINGDKLTGITVMFMDEGMDTGDIILMKEIEIDQNVNSQELHDSLAPLGAEALIEAVRSLESGTIKRTPQEHSKAVYAPMIKKETGLIDWNMSAYEIHNLVRGTDPWPGAYTFYKGQRMKIWKTALIDMDKEDRPESKSAKPGNIIEIAKDGIITATGDGLLKILVLQFENCRKMGILECGHNMDEGELLG